MRKTIDADALIDILEARAKTADGLIAGRTFLHVARIIKAMPSLTLNALRDVIYQDAVAHGLWDDEDDYMPTDCVSFIRDEVNELDCAAIDWEDDIINANSEFCEELADVIIAAMSVAGKLGIDIDEAVKRKMAINKGRPWKHGKDGWK